MTKVSHEEIRTIVRDYEHLMCRSVDFLPADKARFFEGEVGMATSLGFYLLSIMRWEDEVDVAARLREVTHRKLLELLSGFENITTIQEQEEAA